MAREYEAPGWGIEHHEGTVIICQRVQGEFGMTYLLYLGHIISAQGVQVHQENIRAILDWSTPKNVTELRSSFGLCSYYRWFVWGFFQLGAPLTDLTKHGAFIWTKKSQEAFDHMKEVMGTYLVLALPDFTLPFVLECDAFGKGSMQFWCREDTPLYSRSISLVNLRGCTPFMTRKCWQSCMPWPSSDNIWWVANSWSRRSQQFEVFPWAKGAQWAPT